MSRSASHNTACEHRTSGAKQACWHGICVVSREFPDRSVWVVNAEGTGRRLRKDQIREERP